MQARTYFLLSLVFYLFAGCKKTSPTEDEVPKVEAIFASTKKCHFPFIGHDTHFMDSAVYFVNQTDTARPVQFKWDFGDRTADTVKNPVHVYGLPGIYKVTLTTFMNGKPSDTAQLELRIMLGQKEFKTAMRYNEAMDLEATSENGALVLLRSSPDFSNFTYSLLSVDSLLRQRWIKSFGSGNIRLSSIGRVSNNEYILSGNYGSGSAQLFSLTKINANGDLLWSKSIAGLSGKNTYTLPLSGGGFLTVGDRDSLAFSHTTVVKLDANGNELWRKVFNGAQGLPYLRSADNIIETANGYVFAAIIPGFFNGQICAVRLDASGNLLQQTAFAIANGGTAFTAGVLQSGDTFMVYGTNATYAYFLNANLALVKSKAIAQTGIGGAIAQNGAFYAIDGTHQYAYVSRVGTDGEVGWKTIIDHSISFDCSSGMSGATRNGNKLRYTNRSEILSLADGQNSALGSGSSAYVAKYNLDGTLK